MLSRHAKKLLGENLMKYKYWWMQLQGLGNRTKRVMLEHYKSAQNIYGLSEKTLQEDGILDEKQRIRFLKAREQCNLDVLYRDFLETGQSFVTLEDAEYPYYLKEVFDAPYGMYVRGELPDTKKIIAMVGARGCSAYGKKIAQELAYFLGKHGYVVISGMARGIDAYAHMGCLQARAKTIAVLGCGVDVCYPAEHRKLYEQIISEGCVLSEYAPGSKPIARQFPPRNRIISGIARYVVVVEAKERSGSLITTDFALEQGKDIYVVPGRMTDTLSTGCNRLIAQGAGIITSYEQFLQEIEETQLTDLTCGGAFASNEILLEKDELLVYSCFDFYPKSIEDVLQETGLELLYLLSVIMQLCDKGMLRECFKNQYIRMK